MRLQNATTQMTEDTKLTSSAAFTDKLKSLRCESGSRWQFARTVFLIELPSRVFPRKSSAQSSAINASTREDPLYSSTPRPSSIACNHPTRTPCYPSMPDQVERLLCIESSTTWDMRENNFPLLKLFKRATAEALLAETKERCTNGVAG